MLKAKFCIFSVSEVSRFVSLLQTSPGEHVSLCPVRLVSKAFMWNTRYNIYEVRHHAGGATATFQETYLILKADAQQKPRALDQEIMLRLFIMPCFAGRVSCPSAAWQGPFLFGWQWATPGLQRYIEVPQIICQTHVDQRLQQHLSTTSPQTYSRMFPVDMMGNVCCHQSVLAQWSPPTQPLLIPYNCFNVVCWGKGIRWPTGLWHLVSTISRRRQWDLWNGSYTCTWVLLKPPVKATWP